MLDGHLTAPVPFVLRALPLRPRDDEDLPAPPFDPADTSAVLDHRDEGARRDGDVVWP